jgi:hypothetical protein
MPKKFAGENSKSAEAKARKAAHQNEILEKKQKEEEDKLWEDNDKLVNRKLERKEEKEKKLNEKLQRKQETQSLLEAEVSALKSAKPIKENKVTKFEIEKNKQTQVVDNKKSGADSEPEPELAVNPNRIEIDHEVAHGVDEALAVLGIDNDKGFDKNPEKRMKAAYLQFEELNMPRLKEENPNLRLSQLKQLLKKDWMKSPMNPLIQNLN